MASQLFHDLCRAAFMRECNVIQITNNLGQSFGAGDMLQRVSLADQIQEIGEPVMAEFHRLMVVHNPRGRKLQYECPHCGSSACQSAMLKTPMIAFVHHKHGK